MMRTIKITSVAIAALLATPSSGLATAGYFQTGYGQKVIAMGGASDGEATGAMGGANNPASISFSGESFSIGGTYFNPSRSASRTGNLYGLNGASTSKDNNFLIPEMGFNAPLNERLAFGITVYGNGGLNTDYPGSAIRCPTANGKLVPGNLMCGPGHLGVNLEQLIIAPSLSYRVAPDFAVAVSPQLVYQVFSADGIQPFTQVSSNPGAVTNRGGDGSLGIGVKIGFFWQLSPKLTIGGTFSSQADMERFKKYAGLFAGNGAFNVPASYSVGIGYRPIPTLLFAADFERILYSAVPAIGNSSANQAPLGAGNGPGFGWENINVFKFGVAEKINPNFTLRVGFSHSGNPVTPANVTFNILAPGVVQNELAGGLTYHLGPHNDITLTYQHALNNTESGPTSPLLPGGGTDNVSLLENAIGIGFLHKM